MEQSLEITPEISIPLAEIHFSYVRSAGPGGQNVNKVASKAVMRWNLTASAQIPDDARERFFTLYPSYCTEAGDVILTAQRSRDAPKNRAECLEKLQKMLQNALKKPKKRIPTRPTRASVRRRLDEKAKMSEKKAGRRPIQGND